MSDEKADSIPAGIADRAGVPGDAASSGIPAGMRGMLRRWFPGSATAGLMSEIPPGFDAAFMGLERNGFI
jgi:hypothetical protein